MQEIVKQTNCTKLSNGITVCGELSFPVFAQSKKETEEINNRAESDIFNNILISQYLRGIKEAVVAYEKSPMPIKFIRNQKIIVANLDRETLGLFNSIGDDIVVDYNAISGLYEPTASFLFGHEIGHKIAKYTNVEEVYREIAALLCLSYYGNEYVIRETFCDEVGNIVSPTIVEHGILPCPIESGKRQYIQRKILHNVHNS